MAKLNFPTPNLADPTTLTYTDAGITWTWNDTLGVWSSELDGNYVEGLIDQPIIYSPEDGAGSGTADYLKSDQIVDVSESNGTVTLTLDGSTNLADMTGSVFMTDGSTSGGGSFVQSPYTIRTNLIKKITTQTGFAYDFHAGGSGQAGTLAGIPKITDIPFRESVQAGKRPNYATQGSYSMFVLPDPRIMAVYRNGRGEDKVVNLAWSDDGQTWIGAIFKKSMNISPDNAVVGPSSHKYWAFWLTGDIHRPDLFTADPTWTSNKLHFYSDVEDDLKYFKINDTVQGNSVRIESIDLANHTCIVNAGSWKGGNGSGDSSGDTYMEYVTTGGQGTIDTVDVDTNTVTLTATGDRDNQWIGASRGGTPFFIGGPTIVDEPLVTADITLVSSAFATTPNDIEAVFTNSEWNITDTSTGNVQTLSAGAVTTYKPPGGTFQPNKTYRVEVVYQANGLDDSIKSPSISFTTGAVRNISELLSGLTSRIAALQESLTRIEEVESNTLQPVYSTLADLPSASEHHGKTAHVHDEGALYFAHAGDWVKLQNA